MVKEESDDDLTDDELQLLQRLMGTPAGEETGFPEAPKKDDVVKFFRDILNLKGNQYDQISRTGNLKEEELGSLPLHTRAYLNIANYCDSEGIDTVASYLRDKSNIIINTSLSRKGEFLKLLVTQKKISKTFGSPKRQIKKSLFGSDTIIEEGGEPE